MWAALVFLLCQLTCTTPRVCWRLHAVRLVGGNSTSGRVELYLGAGLWGSVCASSDQDNDNESEDDDSNSGSSSNSWNNAAARVVCRQLGFEDGAARTGGFRTYDSALTKADDPVPAVLSGFKCIGNEASLTACARGEMGDVGKCGNGNGASLAGVMCWGGESGLGGRWGVRGEAFSGAQGKVRGGPAERGSCSSNVRDVRDGTVHVCFLPTGKRTGTAPILY